jgi:RNA polymerase sigma factor (sigma-70 family)
VASRSNAVMLRQIQTLFQVGVIGDLTDAQLMERFTSLDRDAAEQAFAALVERHGPMVLRVCRNLLTNRQDAEDACQATFLILVRKARYVWVRDSLAPWLHRVARRVAARAKASALRRREHERRAAELRLKVVHADDHADGLLGLLHTEIDRLPARYRAAVIVCDIEGLSHERAARQLGWPVGTVKSRLARARQILRSRLTARGLAAPTILVLVEAATSSVDAAVTLPVVNSTLRSALLAAKAPMIGVVSVSVANLAEEVLQTMFLTKSKLALAGVLIACTLTAGTAAVLGRQSDGSKANSAAGGPAARSADIATTTGEDGAHDVPDFIKQSRGMIIARLEQELALARTRLDRTLRKLSAPNDPAVLQARRTVAEIEHQLARIDGVLVDAVDRFPTMFDFSGGQVEFTTAPESSQSGTIPWLNVNDVSQSSAEKSGNWHKNNLSDLAPSLNANPLGGANKDGAKGQDNSPSSSAKSGDGQGSNSARQAGSQNADSSGTAQQQSNQAQPQDAYQKPQQNSNQSQQQSSKQNAQQDTNQSQQQSANKPQQQNASKPRQQDATARGFVHDPDNPKANGVAAVDLTVSEQKRTVAFGGQTTFLIRLRNYGTKEATHLLVTADLSRNLEFIQAGEVGIRYRSEDYAVTFQRIDKLEPGKEIMLGITVRAMDFGSKLATCRVSVTHDGLLGGDKLEDMAAVKLMNAGGR